MADKLPTIWEADPHTFAKHEILKVYLQEWSVILSNHIRNPNQSIFFIDGFAGPGIYKGGEDGSPILAIKTILEHSGEFPTPIKFLFIEKNKARHLSLSNILERMKEQTGASKKIAKITLKLGDCENILRDGINKYDEMGKQFGPALVFLDQFGYSDVSLELISLIMKHKMCEVFSFLHWDSINRFYEDESRGIAITRAYGSDMWKDVFKLASQERASFMLNLYIQALRASGAKFVWHFKMKNRDGRLIYWLFFCTNNLRGLEEMKKAMWKVDVTGGFCFSDKIDQDQLYFLKDYTDKMLAGDIYHNFQKQTVTVADIKYFVLTETPAYKFKPVLKQLEFDGKLLACDSDANRRVGTFGRENMPLKFN